MENLQKQNGYVCFYNSQKVEVRAKSSFAAQQEAARILRIKENKRHMISVILCEKDGKEVTHAASDFCN